MNPGVPSKRRSRERGTTDITTKPARREKDRQTGQRVGGKKERKKGVHGKGVNLHWQHRHDETHFGGTRVARALSKKGGVVGNR